jgi:hypothetical protein
LRFARWTASALGATVGAVVMRGCEGAALVVVAGAADVGAVVEASVVVGTPAFLQEACRVPVSVMP